MRITLKGVSLGLLGLVLVLGSIATWILLVWNNWREILDLLKEFFFSVVGLGIWVGVSAILGVMFVIGILILLSDGG